MSVLAFPIKIDIHSLLAPVSGSNPAGESLRYQGTYDRIAEARRQDDARLSHRGSVCRRGKPSRPPKVR